MSSLIPSPLWQMNTAVLTPQRSDRLLPSHFICEPGGSCKGKRASSIMKQQNLLHLQKKKKRRKKGGRIQEAGSTWPLLCCYCDWDESQVGQLLTASQYIIHPSNATTRLMHHTSNSTLWCMREKLQLQWEGVGGDVSRWPNTAQWHLTIKEV